MSAAAKLLRDGSLLIAGGQYRLNDQVLSDFNGQIYYPGYMHAAARPIITGTSPLAMPYGPNGTFTVHTNERLRKGGCASHAPAHRVPCTSD
mgnify:FL=1